MAAATQKIIIHADDKTGAAIASAIRNTKKLDNQLKQTGNAMRNTTRQGRAQMAQLGHQVQDIAVQYQMGMNPLMILGQQGSQVASVFGTKGPLIGALIAVAAVIGQQLIPSLFKAARGFDELKDAADGLNLSIRDLAPFLFEEEAKKLADDVESAEKRLSDAEARLRDVLRAAESGGGIPEGPAGETDYFKNLRKLIKEARTEADLARVAFYEARRAAGGEQLIPVTGGPQVNIPEVQEYKPEKDPLEALKRRAEALKKSLDPMKAYQVRLQDLQAMEANNLITTRELEQATEELRKQFLETADAASKFGLTMQDIKNSGINALEDALVGIIGKTKSAKDAFKDMARSILTDIVRMQVQQSITNPIANFFGIQRRAMGGPVSGNKPYLVGERGPELMIPRGGGTVVPNGELNQGASPVNVTLNISTGVSQTVRAEIANLLPQITQATKAAVADARMRGGSFSKAMVGA